MRKTALLVLCGILAFAQLIAQTRNLSGKVTDENGAALEGATVSVRGSSLAATTKADGTFTLTVPADAKTLVVSFVGKELQEITIGNKTTFSISLKAAGTDPLDEVVVVGYTVRKKRDEAGAISTVRASQLENLPSASLDKALQGKAAGVLVQSNNGIPGGNINVRIRGEGSILAGNQPLYIVDGVQLNVRNDAAFTQSNPLAFLNPDDIESIDILKDAASAAIYGSNAANGVVIVTTKKGKAGKTKFTANVYFGQVTPIKQLDMVNAQDLYRLRTEAVGNFNNLPYNNLAVKRSVLGEYRVAGASTMNDAQADSAAAALKTYDWQDYAFENGQIKSYEVSASGGTDKNTFRVSFSHQDQGTFVTKADFKRTAMKVDLMNKATNKLTFSTSINLSTFEQNNPFATDGSFLGSPAFAAPAILPINPVYNADGTYYGMPGQTPASLAGVLNQNIIAVNDYNSGFTRTNQLVGNFRLDYKLASWLTWSGFGGLDYRLVQGKRVTDARTADGFARKGLVQVSNSTNTNLNAFTTLNGAKSFGDHNFDGVVGYEYRQENQTGTSASGDGFPTYQFTSLDNAAQAVTVGEFFTGFRRNGVFGSVNYNYDRRYLLGATLRYDGSSRFGNNNQYGTFWALKAAWNADQEEFLKNASWISQLRIRAGYGTTGNDQVGNFDGRGLYGGGGVYNGGAGIAYTQLANPDLKWETNATLNLGVDFGFFRNRINGSVEVYDKQTRDLLLSMPLQSASGFTSIIANVGKLQNRGVELTLNGDLIKGKAVGDFNWNVGFIFGFNKQEVKELYGGLKALPSVDPNLITRVGSPVSSLFTQNYAGLNAATGRPMWYDTLGNLTYQVAARDRVISGSTRLPLYQGGLRNTLSYKGFTLDVFFQYEYGRYAQDGQANFLMENITRIGVLQDYFDARWTTPGQITYFPRQNSNGTEAKGSGAQSGDRTWFKADYIRLKNITLSYDLDREFLNKMKLSAARFYMTATNMWTYSDWYSYDVEFVGTSTGIIPQSKNFTVGLQVSF
ncbi:MAG TPA: TonB-dependent receptor [Phnomibacter sp.]|nr:TonB-dependent receptor [Phnomibacter sp.]